jgi:hypothetical protein
LESTLVPGLKTETSYRVLFVTGGFQALKMMRVIFSNLFLLDYHPSGLDGLLRDDLSRRCRSFAGWMMFAHAKGPTLFM